MWFRTMIPESPSLAGIIEIYLIVDDARRFGRLCRTTDDRWEYYRRSGYDLNGEWTDGSFGRRGNIRHDYRSNGKDRTDLLGRHVIGQQLHAVSPVKGQIL